MVTPLPWEEDFYGEKDTATFSKDLPDFRFDRLFSVFGWYWMILEISHFHVISPFVRLTNFPFVRSMWFRYEMRYFHGPLLGEGAYGEVYAMFHRSLGGQSNLGDRGGWESSWNDVTCINDETFLRFFCSPPFKELKVGEHDDHESEDACLKQEWTQHSIYTCNGFSNWKFT